jgi:hypothetical protein
MSYVIYNRYSTLILRRQGNGVGCYKYHFDTEKAAKSYLTRMVNSGGIDRNSYDIAETNHFHANIEKKEIRRGIVHSEGKEFEVGVNTPWTSGPWSETYWCS